MERWLYLLIFPYFILIFSQKPFHLGKSNIRHSESDLKINCFRRRFLVNNIYLIKTLYLFQNRFYLLFFFKLLCLFYQNLRWKQNFSDQIRNAQLMSYLNKKIIYRFTINMIIGTNKKIESLFSNSALRLISWKGDSICWFFLISY